MEENSTDEGHSVSPAFVVVFYAGMAGIAFLYASLVDDADLLRHGTAAPLWQQVAWGIGVGAATVVLSRLASHHTRWAKDLNREFKSVLGDLSTPVILALAGGSALGEELLFRGAMHPHLGLLATAVIFGVIHFPRERRFWPWTAFALVMGLVLGLMVELTGTLVGPIIAHFTVNYFNLHALQEFEPEGVG